ncbi:CPBP family intramembrane glutamic endopeptidase [Robertmurraya andreesenii]|uniref:Membrane protease YdiL (CAAX protease family) n=1 Tax=Anoxybacillus andreesenii TaxID=1325932 RepID=A0ABT9V8C9_9BACL|nr:type II CAAX endopeptidase family protein [Robertmurraya andreesenii]MDQ0157199.1 membrane protease YdiL (CAAX protease family) [Robertmurraya andreesenii]
MNKQQYTDLINQLTDREIMFHLLLTQLILIVISTILGFFLFDDLSAFLHIFGWHDVNIWKVGGCIGLGVVILDLVLMKLLPPSYYDDGSLNERLFQSKPIWQIAAIAAMVAISEEILFRGVIQTHFGLIISSLIFAVIHYRYLFNLFLFANIMALSFLVGYIYLVTGNLLVTIFMHFVIDFLLGLVIRFSKKKSPRIQEGMNHE